MTKMFLPLRSNAAWFSTPETRYELESRLKNYMVIYDEIILQNGRYKCIVGETGSFDVMIPPNDNFGKRKSISYLEPGQKFSFSVKADNEEDYTQLLGGEARVSYEVDFLPILHDANLLNSEYISWVNLDLRQKDKNLAKKNAKEDKKDKELSEILPNNHFQKNKIIESFYIDSLMAHFMKIPFSVDYNILSLINWKREKILKKWKPEINSLIYNNWVSLDLPYFGDLTWEEVHNIRTSKAGKDFREMLQRIASKTSKYMPEIEDYNELKDLINREIMNELIEELMSRIKDPKKAIFDIGMNFIPYSFLYSSGEEVYDLIKDGHSWVYLLKKYN
jgi:hypothetical protein